MKKLLDKFPGSANHFILVAEGKVFTVPTLVQTVLGSCVSVTFHCRDTGIGAMFHALLPNMADYAKTKVDQEETFRYVDTAIMRIYQRLTNIGLKQQNIECKIFGGASAMFKEEMSVGPRNVKAAFEVLASIPLRVTATNVGGQNGRKIVFASHTGEVFVRKVNNTLNVKRSAAR